ncbi:MAG TPA: pyridoxal 5'-phosphate synthase lyase subunit PdxS, partial [Spirochaetia bacterium]|nr:pyridoxal 5'-phosphate synthase lyase subunit PdxS [Spirochaetia bacterium]
AVLHWQDYAMLAELSKNLGDAMPGLEISNLEHTYAERGV